MPLGVRSSRAEIWSRPGSPSVWIGGLLAQGLRIAARRGRRVLPIAPRPTRQRVDSRGSVIHHVVRPCRSRPVTLFVLSGRIHHPAGRDPCIAGTRPGWGRCGGRPRLILEQRHAGGRTRTHPRPPSYRPSAPRGDHPQCDASRDDHQEDPGAVPVSVSIEPHAPRVRVLGPLRTSPAGAEPELAFHRPFRRVMAPGHPWCGTDQCGSDRISRVAMPYESSRRGSPKAANSSGYRKLCRPEIWPSDTSTTCMANGSWAPGPAGR